MQRARKSGRRTTIVEQILVALTSPKIYRTLDYRNKNEGYLKQYMHRIILDELCKLHQTLSPAVSETKNRRKAEDCLYWEGDVKTTINNFLFLGVQHRPDFKVLIDDIVVAVEVKRGDSGSAVREGLGQALVYAHHFDFVVYLFIDTSRDKKVQRSLSGLPEQSLIASLWSMFNVRFEVV